MAEKSLVFENETETENFAKKLAKFLSNVQDQILSSGFNLRLTGNLAAGKTTLTRALLRALAVTGRVKSPTFELVCDYDVFNAMTFHHFDFYRFESPEEFEDAGFRDLFGPGRITVCEWSDRAEPYLPKDDLEILLTVKGIARDVKIIAKSDLGNRFLETL